MKSPITTSDLQGRLIGDKNLSARYVSSFHNADDTCLAFYTGNSIKDLINSTARILLVGEKLNLSGLTLKDKLVVACSDPLSMFVDIVSRDYDNKDDCLSKGVRDVVENGTSIGEGSIIPKSVIICTNTEIGRNCRIQPSSVIGSIGLAYADGGDLAKARFPHLGGVIIEDDVDIGANVTIVKGILQNTIIGRNTKIGNNVNIGHNVNIGKNCFISSGVTLAGSVIIEDECWIAPSVTVSNKVIVKRKSFIAVGSVVSKNTVENGFYAGNPARRIKSVE